MLPVLPASSNTHPGSRGQLIRAQHQAQHGIIGTDASRPGNSCTLVQKPVPWLYSHWHLQFFCRSGNSHASWPLVVHLLMSVGLDCPPSLQLQQLQLQLQKNQMLLYSYKGSDHFHIEAKGKFPPNGRFSKILNIFLWKIFFCVPILVSCNGVGEIKHIFSIDIALLKILTKSRCSFHKLFLGATPHFNFCILYIYTHGYRYL